MARRKSRQRKGGHILLALLGATTVSCVPVTRLAPLAESHIMLPAVDAAATDLPPELLLTAPLVSGEAALEANAALPLALDAGPAPRGLVFEGRTPLDRFRAEDCLAQAIYYEARSESEDGQRAVAQVVLNRVRHPAWPNSVCGVVYQGPARPGGGCQFTFTCDGSLAQRPYGEDWARARRFAAEALAGRGFAPVGLSTFYHANYVMPAWAPRLIKTATFGAHIFYRLPGNWGEARAFAASYSGNEPMPRPNPILASARRNPAAATWSGMAVSTITRSAGAREAATAAPESRVMLEELQIRPEFRQSGQWRQDAPQALRGR